VVVLRNFLSINFERTRDIDWVRICSSDRVSVLEKAKFGSPFSQLNSIHLARMLSLFYSLRFFTA
jgi:hypothetical protein